MQSDLISDFCMELSCLISTDQKGEEIENVGGS